MKISLFAGKLSIAAALLSVALPSEGGNWTRTVTLSGKVTYTSVVNGKLKTVPVSGLTFYLQGDFYDAKAHEVTTLNDGTYKEEFICEEDIAQNAKYPGAVINGGQWYSNIFRSFTTVVNCPTSSLKFNTNYTKNINYKASDYVSAAQYIDKCIATFSSYFGRKVGKAYSCGSGYSLCQDTKGGVDGPVTSISIDNDLSDNEWYYQWGDSWGDPLPLSLCK